MRYLLFFALICWGGCSSDPQEEKEKNNLKAALLCEVHSAPGQASTNFSVYVLVNEQKMKIGQTDRCETISPERYSRHSIPGDALAAVISGGDIFFARQQDKTIEIYQGSQGESNLKYRLIVRFEKGSFHLDSPLTN